MKTTSLTLSRLVVMSKLLEFLRNNRYENTSINFTDGTIMTELKISLFKKAKILFELKSPTETETYVEISANRQRGDKVVTDDVKEEELVKKISSIFERAG